MSFVTHLECADCARKYPSGQPHNLCTDCHRPLWVCYDLDRLREQYPVESLAGRPSDLWRYRELLPYVDAANVVSLGETATPILSASRLGSELGMTHLQIKDESRLPTGSFKARGMAMAITMANELGIRRVACPTAGNAGGAMAAYASRAGMESCVLMAAAPPGVNRKETPLGVLVHEFIPLDTPGNAKRLLDLIAPDKIVWVSYDLWPNHVWEAAHRGIPQLLISGIVHQASARNTNFFVQKFYRTIYNPVSYTHLTLPTKA